MNSKLEATIGSSSKPRFQPEPMSASLTAAKPAKDPNPYLSHFDAFEKSAAARAAHWLLPIRKSGLAYFAELGFPTLQHEEWRFTNVAPIARLKPVFDPASTQATNAALARYDFNSLRAHRLTFVNGRFAPELSSNPAPLGAVFAGSLLQALASDLAPLKTQFARHARCDENAFVALNTALFVDGACIIIPENAVVPDPIHLLFVTDTSEAGAQIHPRNFIAAGARSQASIIENHVSLASGASLNNCVTEIIVGEGAALDYCKLQDESQEAFHIAATQANLAAGCRFTHHSISTGARITRNNIHLVMAGEGVEGIMNGLFLGRGEQVIDHHTVADHASAHCNSHEFYHGVLDGRSRGVFNGKIFVRKDAQKTDAKQTNRNLLLSDDASIDTKPQLEIFADDVKCTHGATVGQLDEEALFYLRSRGIGLSAAREMLVHAFASDVINRIQQDPVREALEAMLAPARPAPRSRCVARSRAGKMYVRRPE